MPLKVFGNNFHCFFRLCLVLALVACTFQGASARHIRRDTVRFKRSVAEVHPITLSDSALNAIGIDSLLSKIENVHLTLDRINNTLAIGYDTADIQHNFPELDSNVDLIDENISLYNSVLDVKNLQMFEILLNDLQSQVVEWRDQLFKYDKDLEEMAGEMSAFRHDTVLRALIADSAFRQLYMAEITDLKGKWAMAKKLIADNQSGIKHLQATVSNEYFETIDLQNRVHQLLHKISARVLGKEFPFIWEPRARQLSENSQTHEMVRKSYRGQRKILRYFFSRNWDDQAWLLFTGILFLLWVFINYRRLDRHYQQEDHQERSFTLLRKVPVLPTLVVLFNIAPFFNLHPPTAYIAIMELLLVISLTILIPRYWPRKLFLYWLAIGVLYIIISFTGALLTPDLGFRSSLIFLNVVSIVLGIFFYKEMRRNTIVFAGMIRIVNVIYIILNAGSVLLNIFGRLSLAKIFSVTAIFGLTQVVGLSVFILVVTEAVQLQILIYKLKGGVASKFNFKKIQTQLHRGLMIVSVVVWAIVFSISLNIYNALFVELFKFLTKPRKIGDTNFQISSLLLFIGIIYISNLLQKGVGSLYGKEEDKWDPEVKKNSSRLAMTRLLLIIIGFLIAVAASGLPVDKITIVLGALGVGIGLGLQGIVNNLVSGVILIFEQPFRIGDYIELGDKRGRVLDIGIRSSKLVLEEGAELIMPNADLLSGRVVNWTLRDESVRIELSISVDAQHAYADVQQAILDELNDVDYVIKVPPPEVLLTTLNDKGMTLKILVWVNDVHMSQRFSSELLNRVSGGLAKKGMKIV